MTEIIIHRVNTLERLESLPAVYGAEIDIRSRGGRLVMNHEPHKDGESLDRWLSRYRHGTLILNPKEEGLEEEILELVRRHGVKNYFFLDLTVPAAVKLARGGRREIAVRFSEYESVETCIRFNGMADWVWIDCFTHTPMTPEVYRSLKSCFRLCLVSPELEGHDPGRIEEYRGFVANYPMDAVCTDFPEAWERILA